MKILKNLLSKKDMKHISALFTLLALVCFSSCQSYESSGTPVQNVVLDLDLDQKLFLSEIADSIEIIPLEQTDESDIRLVWRLVTYKDRYYFFNGIMNPNVLVFDRQGNFIYRLDKKGQGPGEYTELDDIGIDKTREELLVLTGSQGIYRYDLDGRFIDRNPLSAYGDYIATDSVGNIYQTVSCREEKPNSLLFITKEDSVYYNPVTNADFVRLNQYGHSNFFACHNGSVYYSEPYCDSIFNVTNGGKIPFLYINYNGKNFPTKDVFKEGRDYRAIDVEMSNYKDRFRTDTYQISDNFLYVSAMEGNALDVMALYSFKTGKTLSGHRLIDDVFFPNNTYIFKNFNTPRAVEDGWLLWFVRPSWLLRGYNTYKKNVSPEKWEAFCKRHPKMVEVCSQLDEESNPVLFRIKVKDF